jgi:hypothetical protein
VGYETIRRIGRGGMGTVDLGRAPDGRLVALKRLSLHGTPEELDRARLRIRREAEVLERLDHPAIVRLVEVLDEGDDVVLVMDHLPGGNLAQRVAATGPLAPDEVAALADRLLDALATAHRLGIVHRDLKPGNVLFDAEGLGAISDFGVAIHRDATPGLTATEAVVGTPGFMAPEQARGEPATAASDVFSLGATLLFAATGQGPYGTADPRLLLLRAAAGTTVAAPATLPPDLRRRLDAMLAAEPADRPTAAEARGGTAGADATAVQPRPPRAPTPPTGWWRDRRALGAAVIAVLAIGALVGLLASRGADGGEALRGPGTAGSTTTTAAPTTTTTCAALPYQPCGQAPAPHTDGRACTEDHADYDEDPANGCEAGPDDLADGSTLDAALSANLVPAGDVDTYELPVEDRFQFDCGGAVHVTLTAPIGTSQRVTVLDGTDQLGTAVSGDGEPATVTIGDPNCGSDDGGTLTVRVTSIGSDRSAANYELTESGWF